MIFFRGREADIGVRMNTTASWLIRVFCVTLSG